MHASFQVSCSVERTVSRGSIERICMLPSMFFCSVERTVSRGSIERICMLLSRFLVVWNGRCLGDP